MDTQLKNLVDPTQTDIGSLVGQVFDFLPEELKIDPALAVRSAGTPSKKEREKTESLAATIAEVGQLQDAGAYPALNPETGEMEYFLFMGNRRRQAVAHLNSSGNESYTLRVRIHAPEEAKELKRKALIENIHRENYSPIALSHQIRAIRAENGWENAKNWSALVADYLKVSRAQVTQHFRLTEELTPEEIKQVESEGWSAVAAFALLDAKPEKRDEVAKAAVEEAKKEKAEKEAKKAKTPEPKLEQVKPDGKHAKPEPEADPEAGAEVKAKHVRKAARELDANVGPKPLAKSEIIEFFRVISETEGYGYANSPVRQFATYFVTKFVAGVGKEKTLMEKFDAMVMDPTSCELFSGPGAPSKAEIKAREEEDARVAELEAAKKKKKKTA